MANLLRRAEVLKRADSIRRGSVEATKSPTSAVILVVSNREDEINKLTFVRANDDFSLDLQFNDGNAKRFDAKLIWITKSFVN
jgi:hypothetical protein